MIYAINFGKEDSILDIPYLSLSSKETDELYELYQK
jgi:hypothetical protein